MNVKIKNNTAHLVPKRYEPFINDLKAAITNELSKLPDTAKAGRQNKTESTDTVD